MTVVLDSSCLETSKRVKLSARGQNRAAARSELHPCILLDAICCSVLEANFCRFVSRSVRVCAWERSAVCLLSGHYAALLGSVRSVRVYHEP